MGEFDLQKGTTGTSGWWGPGTNTNRSQFAGRTKEYYSQDGILAGYMAAAAVSGAQSKGTVVYIKHMALYDQEDMNAGTTVWVDEQTMRENYLVSFKRQYRTDTAQVRWFPAGAWVKFSLLTITTLLLISLPTNTAGWVSG